MICCLAAWADDGDFDPTNPPEPGHTPTRLKLQADPVDGGTPTGGGKYTPNTQVQLRAVPSTGFRFVNWTNANGTVVSTASNFTYTKGENAETLTAHYVFDPDNPSEPAEIAKHVSYWLTVAAEEGGIVSGGGRYKAYEVTGNKVTVTASPRENYLFAGWYDSEGETLLSANRNYQLEMPVGPLTLLAKFTYNPPSPDEPTEIKMPYRLTVTTEEGGNVYADNTSGTIRRSAGDQVTIRASANSGYNFVCWNRNGVFYTDAEEFVYDMGNANVEFVAVFDFNPDNPGEPVTPETKSYSFYLMNVIGKPGDTVKFPIYLTNLMNAKGMMFQLTFPTEMIPTNLNSPLVSAKAEGYDISMAPGEADEGFTAYVVTMSGSEVTTGNTALLTFDIAIPSTQPTGQSYPVTINQISVTRPDDTPQAAAASNGRISVYKLGDTNADNAVDASDVLNMVNVSLSKETEIFIKEVSDINEDDEIDSSDVLGVVNISLDN